MQLKSYIFLFFSFLLYISCNKEQTLFQPISSSRSGINFNNKIVENDSINPLDLENMYNGGGVGVGDFNNDGLQDLFFTGNLVSNKLYLNKGNFKFDDITNEAGLTTDDKWSRGVAVVDINNDGWLDIYVSETLKKDPLQRTNLLYINRGLDKNGIPHFKEMAKEYGLADTSESTQAAFFDYDNDGDLDVYIAVNVINKNLFTDMFRPVLKNGQNPSTGKLYRNDWSNTLHHPVFTDVSKQAGIQTEGYAHAVNICDINNDGWKDIYISNDFITNDLLWINNHDGTFTEELNKYFKHTSANAMGTDITDINNDGLPDVISLDMDPQDNYRKKMMLNANSYQRYLNSDLFGYTYQYVRNTLQLNSGNTVSENDSVAHPVFSDISFYAGIAQTDWSWTPVVGDFDNDGYKDIIITNGYPKDVTDHDFISYRNQSQYIAGKQQLLDVIPQVKLHNYAYHNNGDLTFTDETKNWGMETPTFSNGAVYVDLDNDGDLDLVVNNINDAASVYQNTSREKNKNNTHYLNIKFAGDSENINGFGAFADIYYSNGKHQFWENTPYRGYLSTIQDVAHFGLDTTSVIDSIIIRWPNLKKQFIQNIKADQTLIVNIKNALLPYNFNTNKIDKAALFCNVTDSVNIHYIQKDKDFIDFNIQKLLPHKFSEFGPGMAAGDINGDGLDDIITGGSFFYSGQTFLQQNNGTFTQKNLETLKDSLSKNAEDEGMLLFDADGDDDVDLYISSGGYEADHDAPNYQDRLYINDGKGNFTLDSMALPQNFTSKFCVRAVDYDKDGDLDLFVAGRVDPWNYPKPVSSLILRNDTKNGIVKFTDVTKTVSPSLLNIGLVCDAVFSDFNNDGWPDLILAGEWMPITFLENNKGVFRNVTSTTGVANQIGWWNTITAGDFDNDGDIDYIVGNAGLNTFYKASDKYPVSIYAKDFNDDGSYDAITSVYIPDNNHDEKIKEFPVSSRDELIKQMIMMRRKYEDYKSYATAPMDSVLTADDRKDAIIYHAKDLASCYLRNDANGKFTLQKLPVQAQLSMLCGMAVSDFDGDGNLDVVINGNDYGTEVGTGRYDALNGLMLKGDGKGNFIPLSIMQSGIFIPGNGKSLVQLRNGKNECMLAASENRGPLRVFKLKENNNCIPVKPDDEYAIIELRNGKKRRQEFYYGISYLSQSSRFLNISASIKSVQIFNSKNQSRTINF
ncbi:MAG: FG-GAP-like repeat-containing protein [Parafilimonas sp.]